MRTGHLVFSLIFLLALAGCSKKAGEDTAKEEASSPQNEAIQKMVDEGTLQTLEGGEIPGDKPVWPEGVTFNKRSRDETIMVRTQALDAVYRRSFETYGEELQGTVVMKFTIYPDGTIGPIQVVEEKWTPSEAKVLTDSMVQRVQQWTFPPGLEKPVIFTQPWRFEP